MTQRSTKYLITIVLLILIASLGYTVIKLNYLEATVNEQTEILAQQEEKIEPYEKLYNLLKDKPYTRFVYGLEIVSGSTISYSHDLTKDLPERYSHNQYSIFYSPTENATLHIVSGKLLPKGDFPFPLTLQKGNAILNESSVRIETYREETNTTYVQ